MPDITCLNNKCPIAYKCLRTTAKPSQLQSMQMFEFKFIEGEKVHCVNYLKREEL